MPGNARDHLGSLSLLCRCRYMSCLTELLCFTHLLQSTTRLFLHVFVEQQPAKVFNTQEESRELQKLPIYEHLGQKDY